MPKNYGSSKFSFESLVPQDKMDRTKLFFAVGAIAVCLIWLLYFVSTQFGGSGALKPPTAPAFRIAQDLNAKLLDRPEFRDVGFDIVTEKPLRYKVVGMVHTAKDLEQLNVFLEEIRPEKDFDVDVIILGR
ncbi:MAG: hypothetical protein ACK4WH_07235 [Phycisphaerales bacterium]